MITEDVSVECDGEFFHRCLVATCHVCERSRNCRVVLCWSERKRVRFLEWCCVVERSYDDDIGELV